MYTRVYTMRHRQCIYICMQRYIGSLAPTTAHCLGWISVAAAVALYGRQTTRNNNIIIFVIMITQKTRTMRKAFFRSAAAE